MNRIVILLGVIAFNFLFEGTSYGQLTTVNLAPTKDAHIDMKNASVNYGDSTFINVTTHLDTGSTYTYSRTFIHFDLDTIPTDAAIVSAKIKLYKKTSVTGTSIFQTKLLDASWTESGVTGSNQPTTTVFTADKSTIYSDKSTFVEFDVTDMAERFVRGQITNHGWSIQVTNETFAGISGAEFYSKEESNSSYHPVLEVKYSNKLSLSDVSVVHESGTGNSDGSIAVDVSGGTTPYTYEWYDGGPNSVISGQTSDSLGGRGYGWYGLHVTDANGVELYQAFALGEQDAAVDFTYDPDLSYTNHAATYGRATPYEYTNANYAEYRAITNENFYGSWYWLSYLEFPLWMDSNFTITKADLTLDGWSHSTSTASGHTNESMFNLVTEDWEEDIITYNFSPAVDTNERVTIPHLSTASEDTTVDLRSFWDIWKMDNSTNHGLQFELLKKDVGGIGVARQYYFSPAAHVSVSYRRPKIKFTLDLRVPPVAEVLFDTLQEIGTLNIDLESITSKQTPYTYFVSKNQIPPLGNIYAYFKDSIYGGTLDSSAFFTGTTAATTYSVSGLQKGKYYVAVYDSNWDRIYDDQIRIKGKLEFESQSGLSVQESLVESSQKDGKGVLELYTNEAMNPVLEIELTSITGEQVFGFIDADSSFTDYQDLAYGFLVKDDSTFLVENGVKGTLHTIVTDSSELVIRIRNGLVEMFIDGTRKYDKASPSSYAYQPAIQLQKTGGASLYAQEMSGPYKKHFFKSTITNYLNCSTHLGSFSFSVSKFGAPAYIGLLYNVKDESGTSVASGSGTTNTSILISNMPAGMYTVDWSINGGITYYSETVWFGYETVWDDLVDYVETPNSYSVERQIATSQGNFSTARSENYLPLGQSGWIRFTPVTTGTGTQYGNNFIRLTNNYPTQFFPQVDEEFVHATSVQGQTFMNLFFSGAFDGSISFPYGTPVAIKHNSGLATEIIANGITTSITPLQSEEHTIRAYTYLVNDGFDNVISSYGCPQQLLSQVGYSELKKQVDAGLAHAAEGVLKFTFDEEYDIESGQFVSMNIYDDDNALIETIAFDGTATNGTTSQTYSFDDLRVDLDITNIPSISLGQHYLLEVLTSTGEKLYLRFIYKS